MTNRSTGDIQLLRCLVACNTKAINADIGHSSAHRADAKALVPLKDSERHVLVWRPPHSCLGGRILAARQKFVIRLRCRKHLLARRMLDCVPVLALLLDVARIAVGASDVVAVPELVDDE